MTEYTFTAADVIAKVRELAAAKPDFVYEAPGMYCQNIAADETGAWVGSCIVGQAVVALGVLPSEIVARKLHQSAAGVLLAQLGIEYDGTEHYWLSRVQNHQDNRAAWARAVELADDAKKAEYGG